MVRDHGWAAFARWHRIESGSELVTSNAKVTKIMGIPKLLLTEAEIEKLLVKLPAEVKLDLVQLRWMSSAL